MKKLLLLAFALLGGAAWLVLAPTASSTLPPPTSHRVARPAFSPARRAPPVAAPAAVAAPTRELLNAEAVRRRLDDQIPTSLYAEAARCYHGGLPPDQRMDLSYRLRIADGELSVTEARVESSTLSDRNLERCIVARVLAFHQKDARMPDYEGEDELFVRVGGFKPFLGAVRADGDDPQ